MRHYAPLFVMVVAVGGWAACSDGESRACQVHADCATGECLTDGTCAKAPDGGASDGGPADAGEGDGGDALDGGEEGDGGDGTDGGDADAGGPDGGDVEDGGSTGVCAPDRDGRISREEVPLRAGLHATFRVALDAAFDTAGTDVGGVRTWDLSGAFDGDHAAIVETQPLEGAWFANDFAGATYAAKLSDAADLLGVFEVTDDALLLRGVVSPQETSKTRLTYDPPVVVLSFPLEQGKEWHTESTVSGVTPMFPFGTAYSEEYDSKVDRAGSVKTPFGTFPTLRVRTDLLRTSLGWTVASSRTFLFASECFGTVASITSKDRETAEEFTRAAELKRLAP